MILTCEAPCLKAVVSRDRKSKKKVFIIVTVTNGGIMFQQAQNNIKLQSPVRQLPPGNGCVAYAKRSADLALILYHVYMYENITAPIPS
jgi:hypothetical protein